MGAEEESSLGVAGGDEVNVNIRGSNGSKFSVKTSLESTVAEFKGVLAQSCDVPAQQQRLIYKGRILKDDQTLASYGLQADHTVHMVRGSAPAASPPSVPTGAGSTNSPAGTQSGGRVPEGTGVASTGAPLFGLGALGGTGQSGLFGSGLPEFEQMQQQLSQNPHLMRDIMNSPAIQSLMSNPEIMRSLIMSNPQMREIIDRNPELAHVLNDPGILRQTLEAARNPELMREMMRNTDRAMSNIESSPEGFNMLRRMYENVQEPFLNATTTGGGGGGTAAATNPFAALFGNQTRGGSDSNAAPESGTTVPNSNPLPNPWSNTGPINSLCNNHTALLCTFLIQDPFLMHSYVLIACGGSQTNNATRTNPPLPSIAGLGGIGLPELDRTGITDPSAFSHLLQNPDVVQITQSLLSNPQYMEQILGLNPQLRSMVDMNPQLREMMQNPEILRELATPETIQEVGDSLPDLELFPYVHIGLHFVSANFGLTATTFSTYWAAVNIVRMELRLVKPIPHHSFGGVKNAGTQTIGLEMLMNMFGGLGAGSFAAANNVPPEEVYASQLSQLQEMGFYDTQENIRALRATSGNVHAAVERLLGNQSQ
ncbi:ubiquitin family protein [Striga asiatica]|uniref:Ubiquitin family protein n=1 Tax=Striga asiatica TaxID=4170 RepID=A0A5A7QAU4_STRAF|nr:ubiquitin family protein [Striga asiatica]